jgi:hypothetical protein
MPYTNIDNFREKWAKSFSKTSLGAMYFVKKGVKIIVDFFCCHLIQN